MAVTVPAANSRGTQRAQLREVDVPTDAASTDTAAPASVAGLDRDYWLTHCEGYRVDSDGGRVGFVDAVREEVGEVVLRVRLGRFGRHMITVNSDQVAFIVPRAQRIWLRTHAEAARIPRN